MGMLAQGIDHTVGHRKWRLAEPQLDNVPAFGAKLITEFVDSEGGGGLDASDVQVDGVAVISLDVHGPGLLVEGYNPQYRKPLCACVVSQIGDCRRR
ncbi:hypothetical protein MARINON1_51246 [Marinobacter salarius]|nr:hypothetical protein MBHK15_130364 [Marinobacter salarius]VXB76762.1 hypothetical protein MARINON1_51246 [Marinobacter salarius]